MVSSWMLQRSRSAWLSANLPLLVLRLLRESSLSEWEVLSRLHSRYGLSPSAHEFGRLEKSLLGEGYARLDPWPGGDKLGITSEGLGLLRRLEEEHREVVAHAGSSKEGGIDRVIL
jgi:hypothetical protein